VRDDISISYLAGAFYFFSVTFLRNQVCWIFITGHICIFPDDEQFPCLR